MTEFAPYRPSILIVDNVLTNVKYLLDALKTDYNVSFELSGKGGIEFAHRFQPDLILLDALMPDMDGFSVCTELRAHAKTSAIPIIFVTSLESPEHEALALDVGASDL